MGALCWNEIAFFASIFAFNSNCLLEVHLMQRYSIGSCLKPAQFTDIGVRNILRPQAVLLAIPNPLLCK